MDFFRADTNTDFFSSALADNRYADTDFLEPIFGADTTLEIQSSRKSQFEFAQRVTLGQSNIHVYILGLPWPRTLINQIHIGGPKALLFYRLDTARVFIYWLAPLVWIRHPLYSSDIIKCMDVGLDFQAKPPSIYIIKMTE